MRQAAGSQTARTQMFEIIESKPSHMPEDPFSEGLLDILNVHAVEAGHPWIEGRFQLEARQGGRFKQT